MKEDTYLVFGIVILLLSIPSFISTIRDGRTPRVPAMMVMMGGGLIAIAVSYKPTGYQLEDIPAVFDSVVRRFVLLLSR